MSQSHHHKTLEQLFAHPTSHNIHWRDIVQMFESLGGTTEETRHDHLKVKFGPHEMTFKIPHGGGHTLQSDHEISAIRRFLRDCGHAPAAHSA
jgi:hypothetical protein